MRSAFWWTTLKRPPCGSPRSSSVSPGKGSPAICSLMSNWSDQNHGTSSLTAGWPSIAAAARLACKVALCTDSSRTGASKPSWRLTVQSPAANTWGSVVRPSRSTTMPRSTGRPLPRASASLAWLPMLTSTTSAGSRVPSARTTAVTRSSPSIRATLDCVSTRTPRLSCSPCRERARQHQGLALQHGDLATGPAGRGRELHADIASADDDDRSPFHKSASQADSIIERLELAHAVELGTGHRQPACLTAGGQKQLVVAQYFAGAKAHAAACAFDGRDLSAQLQFDVLRGVRLGGAKPEPVARQVALEEGLGQRRALVRWPGLATDHHDASLMAAIAQREGGLGTRQARTHDDDAGIGVHGCGVPSLTAARPACCRC